VIDPARSLFLIHFWGAFSSLCTLSNQQRRTTGTEGAGEAMMRKAVTSASQSAPGAVVLLHGSGDNGANFRQWMGTTQVVRDLVAKGVRTVFPSAKPIRYTIAGHVESVWFDRLAMEPSSPEQTDSVERSVAQIETIVDDLVEEGLPATKIAVGGFSMGGGLALQMGLRTKHDLAGVFAMSSYMCDEARVFERLEKEGVAGTPRIWMAHGAEDDFVLPGWGESTSKKLKSLGVDVQWRSYPTLRHEVRPDELGDLGDWLEPLVV